MIRKCYPYGKKKAFNVTYDDGVLQDVRFVELLNQYGLKGTFNLNSALMENEFEWTHETGLVVKRLGTDAVRNLYADHEVASHTLNHPYMHDLSWEGVMWELSQDKRNLEVLFGTEVKGFAVPFDYYSDMIAECVKQCGYTYGRISEMSHSFQPQSDYYRWKATVFHCEECLEEMTHQFVETEEELALFQIVGHSYDLDTENMWERMEGIFRIISSQADILPMTAIEMIEYLQAMEKAEITDQYIRNHSDRSLWFAIDGVVQEVKPKEKVEFMMKKNVAFICVHNSCRSQIAEALGKHLAPDVFASYSAGTETKPQINQDAVRIMKELYGIDMEETQHSKLISDIPAPDIAISMGCNVRCPFIGRGFDDDWGLEDPTGKSDEEFKIIIQESEQRILKLKEELK